MKGRVEQNSGSYKRLRLYSWLQSCVVALLVTAAVFVLWFQSIQITDTGMAPVLQDGDIILFDRLAKHFHTPRRGDAYAFVNEAGGVSIGRAVGLPGEQVQMEAGVVYIDGVALDEGAYTQGSDQSFAPVTLGQGEFLLLPDDRVHALLEEESLVVPFSDLVGRAAIRIAPWRRLAVFVP